MQSAEGLRQIRSLREGTFSQLYIFLFAVLSTNSFFFKILNQTFCAKLLKAINQIRVNW